MNPSVDPRDRVEFDSVTICSRILGSDKTAENELVERFLPRVRTMIAVRISDRDGAEELAQECMLAAVCALREGKLRNPETLPGYIFGIARNLADNYIRRRCRAPSEQLCERHDRPAEPSGSRWSEQLDDARREIERLEPLDSQVLTLTLVDGLEPSEIARSLGLSPEAVRQRKSRAIKRLLARLALPARGPAPMAL